MTTDEAPRRAARVPASTPAAAEAVLGVAGLVAEGAARVGRATAGLMGRSKVARIVLAVALAAAVVLVADGVATAGRVYGGVTVGGVDVGGMTQAEAEQAIAGAYGERLAGTRVVIFASEEARDTVDVDLQRLQE